MKSARYPCFPVAAALLAGIAFLAPVPARPGGLMPASQPASAAVAGGDGSRPLAFPGAEGFGRFSRGGRGGEVLRVTHLGDDGPGSLRAAVESSGSRIVVFEVGGTIALKQPLLVVEPRITIDGATAPAPGITLRDQTLEIAADDVVIRHLRARLGDRSGVEADAIWLRAGRDIILDHVSASWSTDETLSVANRRSRPDEVLDRVTVQWSVITESLDDSLHAKGGHGYGSLIRGRSGARFSFHHNLWAHHRARMPRPGNYDDIVDDPLGPLFDFRNNVFYNWGGIDDPELGMVVAAGYNVDVSARSRYNFVNNAYLPGPDTWRYLVRAAPGSSPLAFFEWAPNASAHFSGNTMAGQLPGDPWSLVGGSVRSGYRLSREVAVAPVATDTADEALLRVLASAGASRHRDAVDVRVVDEVRSGGGRIIDSQEDVGGWP